MSLYFSLLFLKITSFPGFTLCSVGVKQYAIENFEAYLDRPIYSTNIYKDVIAQEADHITVKS